MTRDKSIPPKMMDRIEVLENFMRGYFRTFERRRPLETTDDGHYAISVMEKARVFIVYPDSDFAKNRDLKQHVWERLSEWYRVER